MALRIVTLAEIDIPTAGTRVQVSSSDIPCMAIIFQADPANSGNIYVGDSSVSSTRCIELTPGQTVTYNSDQPSPHGEFILSDFYVDTATNGNDVRVTYVKMR